ncbi:MAG: tyrosine-type recombinase/integrase [Paracoccaceae bacterium]
MKTRLNERKAADLKPKATGYEVRDEIVRGLVLRIGKRGQKVWEVVVQRGKKRQRQRLGTFPAVSVKEARKMAEEAKEQAHTLRTDSGVKTVADLFDAYKAARQDELRTWHDVQSVWDIWAKDRIGHVRATDLSFGHGHDLRTHVSEKSSAIRAGAVVSYLRPFLAWCAEEQLIASNPWEGLKVGAKAGRRERVLTRAEWLAIYEATDQLGYPFNLFMRALMLSGQRISNVAQMRYDEIHGDVWVIPREKVKATKTENATAHEVPLSDALAGIVAATQRRGDYVFTTTGDKPIWPGSKLKVQLQKLSETADWRFHDIRRTAATIITTGNEAGKANRFIVERVLGHADGSVTAIYDRSTYRDEKRAALEVLAASVSPPQNTDDEPGVVRL